jgi:hypothetical protein
VILGKLHHDTMPKFDFCLQAQDSREGFATE